MTHADVLLDIARQQERELAGAMRHSQALGGRRPVGARRVLPRIVGRLRSGRSAS